MHLWWNNTYAYLQLLYTEQKNYLHTNCTFLGLITQKHEFLINATTVLL
jgi:hypothetical protein